MTAGMVSEMTIVSARIYPGDEEPFSGFVRVRGDKIAEMGQDLPAGLPNVIDVGDNPVVPGFIDLHIHGSFGFDVASGDVEALLAMASFLAANGVTAFQPTMGAGPVTEIEKAIVAAKRFTLEQRRPGRGAAARSLGLHLEGPFLSRGRPGAMPPRFLMDPDLPLMEKWMAMGEGTINHVTLAPELPGAPDLARYLSQRKVTVAMGHTTATYEEAIAGFRAGITVSNHTFNAMREFHHREPGALGAALTSKGIYCEIIADGIHVHPVAVALLAAAQDREFICLISDDLPMAGCAPGEYRFLGQTAILDGRGRVTLRDGTLAGSATLFRHGLRNMVEVAGIPFKDAVRMATVNPAKAARVFSRKGSLAPGKDADIVVLSPGYDVLWCMAEGETANVSNGG